MTKPVVLSAGSCIVHHLAHSLNVASRGSERFDYVESMPTADGRVPVPVSTLERCTLLLEEALPWNDWHSLTPEELGALPADCRIVHIPTMHFNSLWPLMVNDPRNVPEPGAPWGRVPFPRTDRLALKVRATVAESSKWLSSYLAIDLLSAVNVKRNHELELTHMFERERHCDIQVAAYVAANFKHRRVFYTHSHPSLELMGFAVAQLISKQPIQDILQMPVPAAIDAAIDSMIERDVMGGEDSPIHPAVAKCLDLHWYNNDTKYAWLGSEYTFEEWMDFYLHYESPTQTAP